MAALAVSLTQLLRLWSSSAETAAGAGLSRPFPSILPQSRQVKACPLCGSFLYTAGQGEVYPVDGPHMVAMGVESMICYWRELLELLPPWLREPVDGGGLDKQVREIRLHLGQPPLLAAGRGGVFSQLPPGGYGGLELCGQHGLPLFRLRRMGA